jgi:putative MATE family efflux protein
MAVDMTRGVIWKQLLVYSIPILLGELFQQFYNVADTIIVGNWVGDTAMAAVGGTSTVTKIMVGFFNGISIGCTVVVARCFGAKDEQKLKRSMQTIVCLSVIIGVMLSVIGVIITRPVLNLLSTPDDVMPFALRYLRIYFAGLLGTVLYNTVTGILRAVGNVRLPFMALIFSSIMNVALDIIFVVGLNTDVAGAAAATIISQLISASLCLLVLLRTYRGIKLGFSKELFDTAAMKDVISIGVPTGVQKMLTALSNVVVLSYVNYFGSASLAGWVVYTKVNHFIVVILQSVGSSITTFVSQNIGAKQYNRARQGVTFAFWACLVLTVISSVFIRIFHQPIIKLFGSDTEMQQYAALFLSNLILLQLFHVMQPIFAAALRGFGEAAKATAIMLSCLIVVRQIYLWVITKFINTPLVVGIAFPLGWTLSGILLMILYYKKCKTA